MSLRLQLIGLQSVSFKLQLVGSSKRALESKWKLNGSIGPWCYLTLCPISSLICDQNFLLKFCEQTGNILRQPTVAAR
jgi:hypothetical protein